MIPHNPLSAIRDTAFAGDDGRPYTLREPVMQVVPVVVDVPHAGRRYPRAFVESTRLSAQSLRRSEDAYVDLLFAEAVALGAPQLCAEFPRAYLDVNREPYELDPRMFEERLPGFANTRSMRVAGGLGTIPRIVGEGHDIYAGKLHINDALERIDRCYRPYHAALRGLVDRTRNRHGICVLLDAHSMPSTGLEQNGVARSDIILGDRYGTSAAPAVVDIAEAAFRAVGLHVTRNRPYAGGFITEHYGDPGNGVHALQIEVNRSLYMEEHTLKPSDSFEPMRDCIAEALAICFAGWTDHLCIRRNAAE
jgi:N-formylglutamate amidohydrolase